MAAFDAGVGQGAAGVAVAPPVAAVVPSHAVMVPLTPQQAQFTTFQPPAAPPVVTTMPSPVKAQPGCPAWVVILIVGFAIVVLALIIVCVMWNPFQPGSGRRQPQPQPPPPAALPQDPFWTQDADVNRFIQFKLQDGKTTPAQAKAWAQSEVARQRAAGEEEGTSPAPSTTSAADVLDDPSMPRVPSNADLFGDFTGPNAATPAAPPRLTFDRASNKLVVVTDGRKSQGVTPL